VQKPTTPQEARGAHSQRVGRGSARLGRGRPGVQRGRGRGLRRQRPIAGPVAEAKALVKGPTPRRLNFGYRKLDPEVSELSVVAVKSSSITRA
jgi:hypothetical protein